MKIVLFDKSEIIVSKNQAEQVERMLLADKKFIKVNGNLINTSAIMLIKQGGVTEADTIPQDYRLNAPDYRGIDSPAKEELRKRWAR